MVLTTLTRMARAGLTEEVLFGPDFKEDWEVRPASSSSRPVSSRCLHPCWAHRCVQGGEGAACAGAPLEGAMWNLEGPVRWLESVRYTIFLFPSHVKLWFGQG